jgi:SAM-dependent methyltransferase
MLSSRAWLWQGRRRHKPGRPLWDWRRDVIQRLAPGKTFIDVGGMFAGDTSFLAEEAGAERVVLFDAMPETDEFKRKHRERDSQVEYVAGDLNNTDQLREMGTFDVVWCTGVIYHTPHPMLQVENLRLMVTDQLVLGTHVIPELPGFPNACLFYPEIPEGVRSEFARAHAGDAPNCPGMSAPFIADPMMSYANFWWGMTPSAVRSLLHICGFDVLEVNEPTPFLWDGLAALRPGTREALGLDS